MALIGRRLRDSDYFFILDKWFQQLENDLINQWLPEASIPVFSVKGEAKKLISDLREVMNQVIMCDDAEKIVDCLWEFGLRELGKDRTERFVKDLSRYIRDQETILQNVDIAEMLENPNSWNWNDVV